MKYEVCFSGQARKSLQKATTPNRQRLYAAIAQLEADPRPGGARKLRGFDALWRIRVGQFRVIYEISDGKLRVLVVKIGSRGDVYKDF